MSNVLGFMFLVTQPILWHGHLRSRIQASHSVMRSLKWHKHFKRPWQHCIKSSKSKLRSRQLWCCAEEQIITRFMYCSTCTCWMSVSFHDTLFKKNTAVANRHKIWKVWLWKSYVCSSPGNPWIWNKVIILLFKVTNESRRRDKELNVAAWKHLHTYMSEQL